MSSLMIRRRHWESEELCEMFTVLAHLRLFPLVLTSYLFNQSICLIKDIRTFPQTLYMQYGPDIKPQPHLSAYTRSSTFPTVCLLNLQLPNQDILKSDPRYLEALFPY